MGQLVMRWLLDTNVVIDSFAGQPAAGKAVMEALSARVSWAGFSAITRLETLGFRGLSSEGEARLRELLAEFNEVAISPEIIDEAIRLRKAIRIDTPDAIIAATALVCQAALVTRNTVDFDQTPGLKLVNTATL